jgi:GNAT superfamily N-acetyltransferase
MPQNPLFIRPPTGFGIRAGRDADGPALIALIWACWSAYPGIKMDVDAEMPELHALATYYATQGGALWIAEAGGMLTGMIATRPLPDSTWEICRVYVVPAQHGFGLGHTLLDHAERHAIAAGAGRLMLYSDTRFDRAHRFYEKRSYVRRGGVRVLNDISNSLEYGYAKPVNGIEHLDIAAAESAAVRLTAILVACVDDGAQVGFLKPLAPAKATAFWRQIASGIGAGTRATVAAWRGGTLAGTGTVDLAAPEDQPHRAVVETLLVHPAARRTGLGRQILQALERAAAVNGRSLLTLQTPAGTACEALARSEAWQEAGRIPGLTRGADGTAQTGIFFWKQRSAIPLADG